jgi:surface polysaccharide O-acyltransferase-like enzyme
MNAGGDEAVQRVERDFRLDWLRVVAAFWVVCLHISADVVSSAKAASGQDWWAGNLVDSFSRWSVPLFVMISGALLLPSTAVNTLSAFYRRRAARLLPPLLFWALFYTGVRYWEEPFSLSSLEDVWNEVVAPFLQGSVYYHLWFLYMIAGLYLAAPFLGRLLRILSKNALDALITVLFLLSAIYAFTNAWLRKEILSEFFAFPCFLGYFLAGERLRQHPFRLHRAASLSLFAFCGAAIALATVWLAQRFGAVAYEITYSYLNPLVAVMTLAVFQFGCAPRERELAAQLASVARLLAPLTLGIYLIHPLWLTVFEKLGWKPANAPILTIPLMAGAVFAVSAVSAWALAKIPRVRVIVC